MMAAEVVSHDANFLDQICTDIIHFDEAGCSELVETDLCWGQREQMAYVYLFLECEPCFSMLFCDLISKHVPSALPLGRSMTMATNFHYCPAWPKGLFSPHWGKLTIYVFDVYPANGWFRGFLVSNLGFQSDANCRFETC